MKTMRYLFPIFVVFIWFTHYDVKGRPHTEIDVWERAEGVDVTANPVDGTLSVTPYGYVAALRLSSKVVGETYHDVCWTEIDDAGGAAVYTNQLTRYCRKTAPVDDVKLKKFADR